MTWNLFLLVVLTVIAVIFVFYLLGVLDITPIFDSVHVFGKSWCKEC